MIYVDVRRPEEFVNGHIPGAININLEDESLFVPRICEVIEEHGEVILYCQSSFRSSYAQSLLAQKHGVIVGNLDGGLMLYQGPLEIVKS